MFSSIPLLLKQRDDNDSTQRITLIRLIVVLITPLLFVVYFYSLLSYSRVLGLNMCEERTTLTEMQRTNEWFKNTRALREYKTITHTRDYKSMTTQWEKEMELFSFNYLRFSPPPDERDPERSQISVYRYVRLLDAHFHLVHRSELA